MCAALVANAAVSWQHLVQIHRNWLCYKREWPACNNMLKSSRSITLPCVMIRQTVSVNVWLADLAQQWRRMPGLGMRQPLSIVMAA
jgi:hypothetical protein